MNIDMIIRDLQDIIFDTKQASSRAYENRKDAERNLSNAVYEEDKNIRKAYDKASDSLADASQSLDKAHEDFDDIEDKLLKIIDLIKMQELSAKVQSK